MSLEKCYYDNLFGTLTLKKLISRKNPGIIEKVALMVKSRKISSNHNFYLSRKWKFQDFCITEILCEINFVDSRSVNLPFLPF